MRSFINWEIIQRIEKSPKEFIVQRKVSLLESFQYGYEILLKPENESWLKEKYKDIPSADEYARGKYQAEKIGTRNFKSIISFTSEGECDFFNNYLIFLKEYENKYPAENPVRYVINETPKISFKTILVAMKRRYRMYFEFYDLADFRAFLDGYFYCKTDYHIPVDTFEEKIRNFTKNIHCESLNLTGDFVTWDRLYRYDRDWHSWGQIEEQNGKKLVEDFWIDLEKFIGETLE